MNPSPYEGWPLRTWLKRRSAVTQEVVLTIGFLWLDLPFRWFFVAEEAA